MNDPPARKPAVEPFPLDTSHEVDPRSVAKPAPVTAQGGFNSLLDSLINNGGEQGKKADDWQMQTRPYDRKTLEALKPAALASRAAPAKTSPSTSAAPATPRPTSPN